VSELPGMDDPPTLRPTRAAPARPDRPSPPTAGRASRGGSGSVRRGGGGGGGGDGGGGGLRARATAALEAEVVYNHAGRPLPTGVEATAELADSLPYRDAITVPPAQVADYHANGFTKVENVLTREEIEALQLVCDEFLELSRTVTTHTEIFDLEPGHTPEEPKLRRVKNPGLNHPLFQRMVYHPVIAGVVEQFFGPGRGVRAQGDKLNMKSPGVGSPVQVRCAYAVVGLGSWSIALASPPPQPSTLCVARALMTRDCHLQWHQDWAFYPHTNDDILAVGLAIDDTTIKNGATQFIPGSHLGPTLDHHLPEEHGGFFCGGVTDPTFTAEGAVSVPVRAGGISLHAGRALHGSPHNLSDRPRRILFMQYTALDAFPLMGIVNDSSFFTTDIILGEATNVPRIKLCPVRMPFPPVPADRAGSIYASQTLLANPLFDWQLDKEFIDAESVRHSKHENASVTTRTGQTFKPPDGRAKI
jgi:phytanoyl-CoA hydroxylase